MVLAWKESYRFVGGLVCLVWLFLRFTPQGPAYGLSSFSGTGRVKVQKKGTTRAPEVLEETLRGMGSP